MILLHAAKEKQWKESLTKGYYGDFSINKDGFIHCSTIEDILDVANDNLNKIEEPLLLLCIDTDLLEAEIKWEKRGNKEISFPHLYGLLNTNAVIDTANFAKDKNGDFYFPDSFLKYATYEKSCGAIVVNKFDNELKILLIKHVNGEHWAFPKGHMELYETEIETAKREINEETGLNVIVDDKFRHCIRYSPKKDVIKDVVYFIASTDNTEIDIQQKEVMNSKWCSFDQAKSMITYKNNLLALESAEKYINNKNSFWDLIAKLVAESKIIIDRPKGSLHPNFSETIYMVDYGYLEETYSMDGKGIDVFVGTDKDQRANAIVSSINLSKRDADLKF